MIENIYKKCEQLSIEGHTGKNLVSRLAREFGQSRISTIKAMVYSENRGEYLAKLKAARFVKESTHINYGMGYPGHHWEVEIFMGDVCIAHADGPNVNGPYKGQFKDMDAVRAARRLPDGPIDGAVDVWGLLCHK